MTPRATSQCGSWGLFLETDEAIPFFISLSGLRGEIPLFR